MSGGPLTRAATDSALNANGKQLSDLAKAVQIFRVRYQRFLDLRDVPASMQAEYNSILSKARAVENSIDAVLGGYNKVTEWIGLGAIPLLPAAIALGALTTILAVSKAINEFIVRVDAARIQRDNPGMTASDALLKAREGASAPTLLEKLGNKTILAIAVVGIVYLVIKR